MENLASGMGVVYKTEDTRLKREVAIKFLSRHIAADQEQRERLKIEAQAPAGLNHSSISTIHAIEEFIEDVFYILIFASRLPYCRFNLALLFVGHNEKRCSF